MNPEMHLTTDSGFHCFGQYVFGGHTSGFGVEYFRGWRGVEIDDRGTKRVGHGDYAATNYYRARTVTVGGECLADTWGDLERMRAQLMALPTEGDVIRVKELDTEYWAYGSLSGMPQFTIDYTFRQPRAEWEAQFKCPQPWLYGLARRFRIAAGETVNVPSKGTVPAAPLVQVDGPITGPWEVRRSSIRRFGSTQGIGSKDHVHIDMRNGSIRSDERGDLVTEVAGFPFTLEPGLHPIMFNSPSGVAHVTVYDTYI